MNTQKSAIEPGTLLTVKTVGVVIINAYISGNFTYVGTAGSHVPFPPYR